MTSQQRSQPDTNIEGARLANWLADYSHDLKEDGDLDQEADELDRAAQWIADRIAAPSPAGAREALADLVEINRRDDLTDPDLAATDEWRAEAWENAKAALRAPHQSSGVQNSDALRALADLFSESFHETWSKDEIVNIIEDAIAMGSPALSSAEGK